MPGSCDSVLIILMQLLSSVARTSIFLRVLLLESLRLAAFRTSPGFRMSENLPDISECSGARDRTGLPRI